MDLSIAYETVNDFTVVLKFKKKLILILPLDKIYQL